MLAFLRIAIRNFKAHETLASYLCRVLPCLFFLERAVRALKPNAPVQGMWSLTYQFQFQTCIIIKKTIKIRSDLKQVESSLQNPKVIRLALVCSFSVEVVIEIVWKLLKKGHSGFFFPNTGLILQCESIMVFLGKTSSDRRSDFNVQINFLRARWFKKNASVESADI